jgi:mRNA deadenylase 3'-5' endonuclease subunit Ccr4
MMVIVSATTAAQQQELVCAAIAAANSAPVCAAFPPRPKAEEEGQQHIRIVSYNILAHAYSEELPDHVKTERYGHVDPAYLKWQHRLRRLQELVTAWDADILCFQEVDIALYESDLAPAMAACGYSGIMQNDIHRMAK